MEWNFDFIVSESYAMGSVRVIRHRRGIYIQRFIRFIRIGSWLGAVLISSPSEENKVTEQKKKFFFRPE